MKIMDEVILWEYRKSLIEYICINNYSINHARHILNNKHFKYKKLNENNGVHSVKNLV